MGTSSWRLTFPVRLVAENQKARKSSRSGVWLGTQSGVPVQFAPSPGKVEKVSMFRMLCIVWLR